MKKHLSTILLVLVFFIGCSLMLYPIVSDWWNSKVQTRAVTDYSTAVSAMDTASAEGLLAQADAYNESLAALAYPLSDYGSLSGQYNQALSLSSSDVMGYITIDRLNVRLPIYHGTSDAALAAGVGHLEGSSLPVGGASTHAVLSAHRGLPTSRLFTDLDKMEVGDTFTVTVLTRSLTYQVDQILIVEPQDVSALQIVQGEDLCTLLTCTPYGINTHRLLVRGHRVDTPVEKNITIPNEATRLDSLLLAPVIAVPMLLVLLVYLLVRYRRRKPEGAAAPAAGEGPASGPDNPSGAGGSGSLAALGEGAVDGARSDGGDNPSDPVDPAGIARDGDAAASASHPGLGSNDAPAGSHFAKPSGAHMQHGDRRDR